MMCRDLFSLRLTCDAKTLLTQVNEMEHWIGQTIQFLGCPKKWLPGLQDVIGKSRLILALTLTWLT